MSDTCQNELYCEIGRVAVAWSKIDNLMIYGISHFSQIPIEKAQCMFVGVNSHSTLNALECLLGDACGADVGFCEEMTELLDDINDAKNWRNDLQHTHIELTGVTAKFKKTEKKNKTEIRIRTTNYDMAEFKNRCESVSELSDRLESLLALADSIVSTA